MVKNKMLLFFLLNVIIAVFYFDTWPNGNTTSRILPIVSVIDNGTYNFEMVDSTCHDKSIIEGKHYTDKAPLPTFLMLPIATLLKGIGLVNWSNGDLSSLYAWSGFFLGTIPFLLIIWLVYLRARPYSRDVIYLFLPFYGSYLFSYSASMYSHVFVGLLLVLSFICMEKKKFVLAGLLVGAVFISEYPLALIGLIWGLQIWYKEGFKKAFYYAVGVVPSILLIGIYNYQLSGNPTTLLYKYVDPNYAFMHTGYGMSLPSMEAFIKLLFSQYRGVFFYCPTLILIAIYGIKNWNKLPDKWKGLLTHPIIVPFIACALLISSYQMWRGGWSFGPRHLIAVTLLMLYYYLPMLSRSKVPKWLGYPVLFVGVIIGLMAKTTFAYSIPTLTEYPVWHILETIINRPSSNPNNLLTYFYDVDSRVASYIYATIFVSTSSLIVFFDRKGEQNIPLED